MTSDAERAPADIIDGVLTKLIYELPLRTEHRRKLLARGLSAEEIARKCYVSVPASRAEHQRAADALAPYLEAFGGGVPGFFKGERGRWQMVYRPSGFLIPVRDECGRIQALAQRVDDPRDGGKYIWLSSSDRDGGVSSGAPAHFAGRHLMHDANELTITEGSLKAEIISYFTSAPVIGVAGTHAIRGLAERLKSNFPRLRRVLVAYDRDMLEKTQVLDAAFRLTEQLESIGFQVRIRTWPGQEKGLDDYLLSQSQRCEVRAT
jgi:hypothetical protein